MVVQEKAVNNEIYKKKVQGLLDFLGIENKGIKDYILAFIHRSIVNEKYDFAPEHNERLEFLGDAVLELIVTTQLYLEYSKKPEGELTDMRSSLVRGRNLATLSRELGFSNYLILGKGEELSGGRDNDYLLANVFESFIGALYLDLGYEEAKKFVLKHLYSKLTYILENNLHKDYKSLIQEYSQAEFSITPHYEVLSEEGPDHDKIFVSGVYLDKILIGKGEGSSKKKSQEIAAQNSFENKDNWKIEK